MNSEKKDTFQQVTDSIVNAIEAGAGNYRMPWRVSGGFPSSPINAASKHPYRGVNILVLWAAGLETGFKSGTWATYRQWQELGAQVKKGEKSTNVVFWKFLDREKVETDGAGESRNRRIPMARDYSVFNAEQVDGYSPPEQASQSRTERVEAAESFFRDL